MNEFGPGSYSDKGKAPNLNEHCWSCGKFGKPVSAGQFICRCGCAWSTLGVEVYPFDIDFYTQKYFGSGHSYAGAAAYVPRRHETGFGAFSPVSSIPFSMPSHVNLIINPIEDPPPQESRLETGEGYTRPEEMRWTDSALETDSFDFTFSSLVDSPERDRTTEFIRDIAEGSLGISFELPPDSELLIRNMAPHTWLSTWSRLSGYSDRCIASVVHGLPGV